MNDEENPPKDAPAIPGSEEIPSEAPVREDAPLVQEPAPAMMPIQVS